MKSSALLCVAWTTALLLWHNPTGLAFVPTARSTRPFSSSSFGTIPSKTTMSRQLSVAPSDTLPTPAILSEVGATYQYCLDHYQLATQSLTGGIFAAAGDVLAQTTTTSNNDEKPYNLRRTGQFFCKGLGSGLLWSTWYNMADDVSSALLVDADKNGMDSSLLVVYRVVTSIILEQFVVAPTLYTIWDIPVPALLQGTSLRAVPRVLQVTLAPLLRANAVVWTPANIVTYTLPADYRLVFASAADLVWQTVSSRILNRGVVGGGATTTTTTMAPVVVVNSPPSAPTTTAILLPKDNGSVARPLVGKTS